MNQSEGKTTGRCRVRTSLFPRAVFREDSIPSHLHRSTPHCSSGRVTLTAVESLSVQMRVHGDLFHVAKHSDLPYSFTQKVKLEPKMP